VTRETFILFPSQPVIDFQTESSGVRISIGTIFITFVKFNQNVFLADNNRSLCGNRLTDVWKYQNLRTAYFRKKIMSRFYKISIFRKKFSYHQA
jgi:hypothetical protein